MSNMQVNEIVNELNTLHRGADFSHVIEEIDTLHRNSPSLWQSSIAEINSRVDMRALGFAEDFSIVGTDRNGNVLTLSADHRLQTRERGSLQADGRLIESSRQFDTADDGRAAYTVKAGDNLWSIAKDLLQRQSASEPTPAEISKAYKEIARENGIANPNLIHPGQVFAIPETLAPPGENRMQAAPVTPVNAYAELSPSSPQIQPLGETYNPIAPPGLPGAQDKAWTYNEFNMKNSNGESVSTYEGNLYDDWLGLGTAGIATHLKAQSTLGPDGQIVKQSIAYDGDGKSIQFDCGGGGTKLIEGVLKVEVAFDPGRSGYLSTIYTRDGQRFKSFADSLGHVLSLEEQGNR